ncbi:MAG: AMP-binding protein [Desulfobacteraceae bacterium]|nr:AMP-binding protein [Desulfobacteraceae bacterium]
MEKIWMKNWPLGISQAIDYIHGKIPIFEYLRFHARSHPEKVAINFYGLEITYAQLDKMSDSFAAYLTAKGVKKGDRVALYMQSCPQYIICQIGVHKMGGIVIPCGPMGKAWELEGLIAGTRARVIVCLDQLYPVVEEVRNITGLETVVVTSLDDFLPEDPIIPLHESLQVAKRIFKNTDELTDILAAGNGAYTSPQISIDDVCLLQFTSGTTGMPKGAMLTHANQLFKSACQAQVYKYEPDDVVLSAMPIYHIAGMLWGMTTSIYAGCTMVIQTRFDARAMATAISRLKCTKQYGTASMNTEILKLDDLDAYDLTSMKINPCTSFGIFLTEEIAEKWRKVTDGCVLIEAAYGLSESHTGDTFSPLDKPRVGSVGIPNYETDLKIVDFDDPTKELGVNEVGEITVKSPAVFKGYWERPEETSEALRDGRLYTGDMGKFDEDGYVYYLGRKKEMIKSSGYTIAPEEVEEFLMRHPAVVQAACIPVPDPKKGEVVKAFIVLNPEYQDNITDQDIIAWSREKMAAYKYPRFVEFRTELPAGSTGKLLRRILRDENESEA